MEPGNASAGKGTPLSEKSNQSTLDQSLADVLVQINQQLVGVMKQNAETMTVMKAMLQRQGFSNRILQSWLNLPNFQYLSKGCKTG